MPITEKKRAIACLAVLNEVRIPNAAFASNEFECIMTSKMYLILARTPFFPISFRQMAFRKATGWIQYANLFKRAEYASSLVHAPPRSNR